jgi:hypothetical protein
MAEETPLIPSTIPKMGLPHEDPSTTESETNSMTMNGDIETIPDLKYRGFMLNLSRQITAQDMAELKYMLTSLIPDGRKESLDTALELFRFLEQQLFIGPNNLGNLQELFRLMDKQKLYEMVRNFNYPRRREF